MSIQQKVNEAFSLDSRATKLYEQITLIIAGSVLLAISAKMMVPFWPVPMTFQPFAVIMVGLILGPRLGFAACITYLLEGMVGLPVFADTLSYPGLSIFAKPSAGFLLSFPLTAFLAGYMKEKGWTQNTLQSLGLFLASYAVMYSLGMAWLISFIGAEAALSNMMLWIPGDLAKIGLGVAGTQAYLSLKK